MMVSGNKDIVIKTEGLTRKFGNFTANNNLTFEVYKGEIFGFLGANGAGKTTTIRILCGLLSPTSGQVEVSGFDVYHQANQIKKNIGYMSQKFSLYEDMTVYENIRFYGGIYGLKMKDIRIKATAILTKLGLSQVLNTPIASLPLGWKQKLAFSIAMLHEPKIIFLDEPTGGVDPITRRQFWDMIYEASSHGITVFVTTHYMDEAEYCDRVSIMVDGEIVALDTPQVLKETYMSPTMNEVFIQLARKAKNIN